MLDLQQDPSSTRLLDSCSAAMKSFPTRGSLISTFKLREATEDLTTISPLCVQTRVCVSVYVCVCNACKQLFSRH